MSTWEQRAAFMKEEVPLPSSEPSVPLNKQLRSTPIPKKRSGKIPPAPLGQPRARGQAEEKAPAARPAAGGAAGTAWGRSASSRLLQLVSGASCHRSGAGGSPEARKAPRARFQQHQDVEKAQLTTSPWRTLTRGAPAFNAALFSIKGFHCGHELPGSGAGSVPRPESHARGPGLIYPLRGVGKHPQGLAQEPRGGSLLSLPAVGGQSWREGPAILPLGIRAAVVHAAVSPCLPPIFSI